METCAAHAESKLCGRRTEIISVCLKVCKNIPCTISASLTVSAQHCSLIPITQ